MSSKRRLPRSRVCITCDFICFVCIYPRNDCKNGFCRVYFGGVVLTGQQVCVICRSVIFIHRVQGDRLNENEFHAHLHVLPSQRLLLSVITLSESLPCSVVLSPCAKQAFSYSFCFAAMEFLIPEFDALRSLRCLSAVSFQISLFPRADARVE